MLTFVLTKALPGDPSLGLIGERASPEAIEKIKRELDAGRNVLLQYGGYLKLRASGEFGRSYYTKRRVLDDLVDKFPNTLLLAVCAMAIAVPGGVVLGFAAALTRGAKTDRMISSLSVLGLSVPVFWAGLLIMLILSLKLKLLPPSGMGDIRFLIMPSLTLALPALAGLTRVSRTTMIEILAMPYVRYARAKGLTEWKIRSVHVERAFLQRRVYVAASPFYGVKIAGYVADDELYTFELDILHPAGGDFVCLHRLYESLTQGPPPIEVSAAVCQGL